MKLICVSVTAIYENVYIYYDEHTNKGIMIDPGGEPEKILKIVRKNNIDVKAVLLTHGHFDHIAAVAAVKEATGAPVYVYKDDAAMLADPAINLSRLITKRDMVVVQDYVIGDGDLLSFDEIGAKIRVIHTPGHTSGSSCYFDAENSLLFSGDTLFFESIGRTDFPGGDGDSILESIRNKLFVLPDDTVVYPGHGGKTSIGHEKGHNVFLKGC